MLELKLTRCASLLYHWILQRQGTNVGKLKVDLQDFQAWTGEYREKPYSDREIFDALRQLKQLDLISVARTEVTLVVKAPESNPGYNQQPEAELRQLLQSRAANSDVIAGTLPTTLHMLLQERERPNPLVVIVLVALSSFLLGLTPILIGFTVTQTPDQTPTSLTPWSVLAQKYKN